MGGHRLLAHLSPGDRICGHRSARAVSPLRHDGGARALVDDQAGISRHARGRHRAHRKRRSSLPDESRVEVRRRARYGGAGAASAPDDEQRAARTGRFAAGPDRIERLQARLSCGIIRGDGHIGSSAYERADGAERTHAPASDSRSPTSRRCGARERYLLDGGRHDRGIVFQPAGGGRRAMLAISHQAARRVDATRRADPLAAVAERRLAQGLPGGHLRRRRAPAGEQASADLEQGPAHPGLDDCVPRAISASITSRNRPGRTASACIRIRGGLRERLRFFHLTDPAITRKRTVQGMALKSDAKTRVVSIEPLGMAMRLYDITTGTGDFIANGVVSHNCFARPTHTYLGLQRRPRLREGDRRQGQRARGAARRAGAAVVEGRARRDGDQHRPVPVGRGALQAHARDLGGVARCGQPVLGADEVAAAAARPRPDEGDRRRHGHQRQPVGARRSTRRRGGRASRTRPTRGRGWRPWASSTGRGSRPASWSRR